MFVHWQYDPKYCSAYKETGSEVEGSHDNFDQLNHDHNVARATAATVVRLGVSNSEIDQYIPSNWLGWSLPFQISICIGYIVTKPFQWLIFYWWWFGIAQCIFQLARHLPTGLKLTRFVRFFFYWMMSMLPPGCRCFYILLQLPSSKIVTTEHIIELYLSNKLDIEKHLKYKQFQDTWLLVNPAGKIYFAVSYFSFATQVKYIMFHQKNVCRDVLIK